MLDVISTCVSHALTTECEEIMGLLLGNTRKEDDLLISCIWGALPQMRADRRKDRVEPSDEQLSQAIILAEERGRQTGVETRVVGWYHSHPKITVQPSSVDLRTQDQHQRMDAGFVGLIISCFNRDQTLKCTAFQSDNKINTSTTSSSVTSQNSANDDNDVLRAIKLSLEENKGVREMEQRSLYHVKVPLVIKYIPSVSKQSTMGDIVYLQEMLLDEEKKVYAEATDKEKNHSSIMSFHHGMTYLQSLAILINSSLLPLYQSFVAKQQENSFNIKLLDERIATYNAILSERKKRHSISFNTSLKPGNLVLDQSNVESLSSGAFKQELFIRGICTRRTSAPADFTESESQRLVDNLYDLIPEDLTTKRPSYLIPEKEEKPESSSKPILAKILKSTPYGQEREGMMPPQYNHDTMAFPLDNSKNQLFIPLTSERRTHSADDNKYIKYFGEQRHMASITGVVIPTMVADDMAPSQFYRPNMLVNYNQHHITGNLQQMGVYSPMANVHVRSPFNYPGNMQNHIQGNMEQQQENSFEFRQVAPSNYFSDSVNNKKNKVPKK